MLFNSWRCLFPARSNLGCYEKSPVVERTQTDRAWNSKSPQHIRPTLPLQLGPYMAMDASITQRIRPVDVCIRELDERKI
jgi:hypothetical protein